MTLPRKLVRLNRRIVTQEEFRAHKGKEKAKTPRKE